MRWCLLLLIFPASWSWASTAHETQGRLVLSEQLDYLRDPEGKATIERLRSLPQDQWISARGQNVNFGFTDAVYWFRVALPACASSEQKRILEIAYPPLDDITVWEWARSPTAVVHRLGDRQPFQTRPIEHSNFAVPVGCADETTLFFRVSTTSAMQFPLVLWDRDSFYQQAALALMPQAFYFGAMLVMAIYNLFVFVSTRKLAYLYYVVFTLSFAAFVSALNGTGFRYVWPGLPWLNDYIYDKSLNSVTIFALSFAIQYMRVDEYFPKLYRFSRFFVWTLVAYALLSFALPYPVAIKCTIILIMAAISLGFWINLKCILNRQREGYFYIVAWSMFLNAALVLALNKLGLLPRNALTENSIQWASLMESILLSLALADQLNVLRRNLAASHKELKSTFDSIEATVSEKTEDIRSILSTVQQGIMTIRGHDLLIEADYSPYALKVLGAGSLAGMPVKKAFLDRLILSEDERQRVHAALQACLSDGMIAFELNVSQFPHELRLKTDDGARDLLVDWTPILQSHGTIDRFLIAFRDVTDWKKLESIQASQRDVLNKLQQMTQADPQLLRKFLSQSERLLEMHLASSMHVDPASILKNVFIDIHTLKGEARSLGLLDLAEACHSFEDSMSRMRNGQMEASQLSLQTMLLETQEILQSYQRVYEERLKGMLGENDVLVKGKLLDQWREDLNQLAHTYPAESTRIGKMLQEFHAILFISFDQFQIKLRRWCRRMALDLGRPEPQLNIHSEIEFLDGRITETLDKIFIHILQNALAHGIEAPEVRRMHGKPLQGCIHIRLERQNENVVLVIRDDGRGFDTQRIQRKAVLLGLIPPQSALTHDRLRELVLTSGFSSLESVHSYAGRGVGLDAVQDLVKQLGGRLTIELFPEEGPGFIPFQYRIDLSMELFPRTWLDGASLQTSRSA